MDILLQIRQWPTVDAFYEVVKRIGWDRDNSPCKGGVDATSRKWRGATLFGTDAASVASQHFLTGAATPPP